MRTLIFTLCCLALSTKVYAYIPDLFDGADEGISQIAEESSLPPASYRLPSHRFMNIDTVRRIRFTGNYGVYEPELQLPIQTQGIRESENGYFPHDACSALMQCLFPCPDGVILLANQAYSDLLSRLTPRMLGSIMRQVDLYCQQPLSTWNEVDFKRSILETLLGTNRTNESASYDKLQSKYSEALKHDLKKSVVAFFAPVLEKNFDDTSESSDEESQERNLQFKEALEENRGFTAFAQALEKYIGANLFSDGELEECKLFLEEWSDIRKLRRKNNITPAEASRLSEFTEQNALAIEFEDQQDEYRAFSFADVLFRALKDQVSDERDNDTQRSFPYVSNIVQRTLMSYFWLTALNHEDIAAFYGTYFGIPSESILPHLAHKFDQEGYQQLKARLTNGEAHYITAEALAAGARGFQLFDSPLPPLIQFKNAYFTPKTGRSRMAGTSFSDCVETSIRDALLIVSRVSGSEGYYSDGRILGLSPDALPDFETDPERMFSQEAHNLWGSRVSEIDGVTYCKPSNSPRKKFELHTGILNSCKVIAYLFGERGRSLAEAVATLAEAVAKVFEESPEDEEPLEDLEGTIKEVSEDEESLKGLLRGVMNALSELFSREGFQVVCRLDDEDPDWNPEKNDIFEDIIFQINGEDTFCWTQDEVHSYVKYFKLALNDWRKEVNFEEPETEPSPLKIPYIPDEQLELYLDSIPDEQLINHLWSVNLDDRENIFTLFKFSLRKWTPTWRRFIPVLMKSAQKLDDYSTDCEMAKILYEAYTDENSLLSAENMLEVLTLRPKLLKKSFHGTFYRTASSTSEGSPSTRTVDQTTHSTLFEFLIVNRATWILPLAKEKLSKINISRESFSEFKDQLREFKNLKELYFTWYKGDEALVMEALPLLPSTVKAVDFSIVLRTTQAIIDVIKSYTDKFPKIKLEIGLSSNNTQIDRDAVERFIEEQGLSKKRIELR